jgi:ribosomal protein S18 acetylase RimI-like enzyme
MTASGGRDARTTAIVFLREVEDACAERIVLAPGGHAVLDARHPALWDANHLRVESAAASPQELLAAAERHQSALAFRAIHVLHADSGVGAELEAPLRVHGYAPRHDLLMLLGATPSAHTAAATVVEATPAEVVPTHLAAARDTGLEADVGRQLASRGELMATVVRVRWFTVLAQQRIVARCALIGGNAATAQIENVYTDPAHRRRGLAGTLVAHAACEARAAGAEVVFLRTDASGSAQGLYRRLGFVEAGLLPRFHRR